MALGLLAGSLFTGAALAPPAQAAVTFSKTVDKATVAPGENVTFTLRYTCSVTDCANGVITDSLPPDMEFVGWTPDASSVDVPGSSVPAVGSKGGTLKIKLLDLTPGTTAGIQVVLKYPNFSTANGTKDTNSATLTADGEPVQTGTASTMAVVQPQYTVTKGVQNTSQDGRTVTYQFSACSKDRVPNVDLDASHLTDTLPVGAVVDTARSPGWSQVSTDPNVWTYDIGAFRSGNGQAGCRTPGVMVVDYPLPTFPNGTTSTNRVTLSGDPLGPDADRELSSADATTSPFQPPVTGVQVQARKTWPSGATSGDVAGFSLFATNLAAPATSLVMTDPGNGTTAGLYNWFAPQSVQLDAWNPSSIALTLEYRLDGDPAWHAFTPGTAFNGAAARRITFAEGAGDPANDVLGIPAGRWLDGLRFSWNGPIPTGWSPGNSVQVLVQVLATGHDGRSAPKPLTNCVDVAGTDGSNTSMSNACADLTVTDGTNLGAAKTTTAGAVLAPGATATFQVIPYNRTGRVLDKPLVLFDLLPPGLVYVEGSARPDPAYPEAKGPQEVVVLPGRDGRQLLRMTWPAGSPDMMYLHDSRAYRTLIDAQVAGSASAGTLTNDIYVTVDGPSVPVTCMNFGTDTGVPDTTDLNGNGDTTEKLCHASSQVEVQVPKVLRAFKEVKGDLDADYGSVGTTSPGGSLSYRMTVRNDSAEAVTDFVAYDRLPGPGDGYVLRPDIARGSGWTPSLTQPLVSSDPTVVIEYTTDPNPCRPAELPAPGPCNAGAAWSTTFPGPGAATWFRIHRPGSLPPGGVFTLSWPMVASIDAPDQSFAWNSFAYTATDSTGSPLLPAEPAKVGIAVKRPDRPFNALGDLVWDDVNQDGLQQPGEPGVQGVTVHLLDGTGMVIRNKSGAPVTTVTDANGHYLFADLPDGSYSVRFDLAMLPKGATVTRRHVGADPALDSDADPATGVTQTVALSGGMRYLDLDMGLILPVPPTPPTPPPTPPTPPPTPPTPPPTPPTPPPTPPTPPPTPPTPPVPSHSWHPWHPDGELPHTGAGAPVTLFAALAAILTAGGTVLFLATRPRRGRHG